MNTPPALIIAYIVGFILIYVLCRVFIKPIKWLFKLTISCAVGCLIMGIINYMFGSVGNIFSINPMTAMISGVLGIPGIVATFVLQGIL